MHARRYAVRKESVRREIGLNGWEQSGLRIRKIDVVAAEVVLLLEPTVNFWVVADKLGERLEDNELRAVETEVNG